MLIQPLGVVEVELLLDDHSLFLAELMKDALLLGKLLLTDFMHPLGQQGSEGRLLHLTLFDLLYLLQVPLDLVHYA